MIMAEARNADTQKRSDLDTLAVSGSKASMAQGMNIIQVYLDANRHGRVCCLLCGATRVLQTDAASDLGGKIFKVRCQACTGIFRVRVELRRHHHLDLQLSGKLFQGGTSHLYEPITVTSLSASGMGFVLQDPRRFTTGQRYEVAFVLADSQQTLVLEDIILTRLEGTVGGAAFFPLDKYNHDLDFYLVPLTWPNTRGLQTSCAYPRP
jgi:hypothetical protein